MRSPFLALLLLLVPLPTFGQCAGGSCSRPARVVVVVPTPARVVHPTYVRELPYRYRPGPAYFYARPHVRHGFFARWFAPRACR